MNRSDKMKGKVFTAQEVRAILNGSKVMFREVIKPQPKFQSQYVINAIHLVDKCPYQVGQKIFCKESFCEVEYEPFGANWIDYRATPSYGGNLPAGWDEDPTNPERLKWKPAQHMKQEHSRLTLLIKEIRVERLAEMKPIDCVHEGIWKEEDVKLGRSGEALDAFANYWNATHKKPEEKFEANLWVWVVSFEVVEGVL